MWGYDSGRKLEDIVQLCNKNEIRFAILNNNVTGSGRSLKLIKLTTCCLYVILVEDARGLFGKIVELDRLLQKRKGGHLVCSLP